MLLVLGHVARDRLVTELGELDAQLLRRDLVHAVADDRPRPPRQRMPLRGERDRRPAGEHLLHRRGQLAERGEQLAVPFAVGVVVGAELGREPEREQVTGGELRVERLRGRDAHLHVAAVGGVEHAVALVDEVALAPVHDRDHDARRVRVRDRRCGSCRWWSPTARSRPRSCRACRRASSKPDSSVAVSASIVIGRAPSASRSTRARLWPGDVRAPLPDHEHAADRFPSAGVRGSAGGSVSAGSRTSSRPSRSTMRPRKRLAERRGRFGHLLEEVVRGVAAGDVARRDLGRLQLGFDDRQRAAVVRLARDARRAVPRAAGVDHDDLALRRRVPRLEHRLAVEAEVAVALLHDAVGLARHDEAVVAEPDVERLAAAAQREQDAIGVGARRPRRSRPILRTTRPSSGTPRRSRPRTRSGATTSAGMTLASVVISGGRRSDSSAFRSA